MTAVASVVRIAQSVLAENALTDAELLDVLVASPFRFKRGEAEAAVAEVAKSRAPKEEDDGAPERPQPGARYPAVIGLRAYAGVRACLLAMGYERVSGGWVEGDAVLVETDREADPRGAIVVPTPPGRGRLTITVWRKEKGAR